MYRDYHDREWGRPVGDDRTLFEKMVLEGFQAGLSWLTILRKRDNFRRAFRGFDIGAVSRFNSRSVGRLVADPGIIRHRGKIESAINNAHRALEVIDECGSLASYLWRFEPAPSRRPRRMTRAVLLTLTSTPESQALSADLKRRGFTFVGPTTMYAHMQAMGMVNDHLEGCDIREVADMERRGFARPA